ncbi:MAG: hypothetical protein QM725_13870 [Lacibacter sp.]
MDTKTTSWVSYLWWIGWIISFVTSNSTNPKPPLIVFHLRQSFGLLIIQAVLWILNMMMLFSFSGWYWLNMILSIGLLILWILGLISAVQGEEKPVPLLGEQFQQWFQFIK